MVQMSKHSKRRFGAESLEPRLYLSASSGNGVSGSVQVHGGDIAGFEVQENSGGDFFGQSGVVAEVDEAWKTVFFQQPFMATPIVVAGPPGFVDEAPAIVRIRNVTPQSFEVRVQRWEYNTGDHAYEELAYLALEQGAYETIDGTRFLAGQVSATTSWSSVPFSHSFSSTPVVLGQVASDDDATAVGLKVDQISSSGFDLALQPELLGPGNHGDETVGFIAVDAGVAEMGLETRVAAQAVDHLFRTMPFSQTHADPLVFAMPQSNAESDPGHLRLQRNDAFDSLSSSGVGIRFQEEDSRNAVGDVPDPALRRHADEDLGIVVLSDGFTLQGYSVDAGTTRTHVTPQFDQQYGAISVGNLNLGPGLSPATSVFDNAFGATGWESSTEADAIANDDYLTFSIDVEAGYSANLNQLELSVFSDQGAREFAVFASTVGFQAGQSIVSIAPTTSTQISLDLSSLPTLQDITGEHEFRIYGFGHTGANHQAGLEGQVGAELVLSADVIATPPIAPSLVGSDVVVVEGQDAFAVFDIQLDEFHNDVTVDFILNDVSATGGSDYGPTQEYSLDGGSTWDSGSQVVMPAGRRRVLVRTPVVDDSMLETQESLELCVSVLGPTVDVSFAPVNATIRDDDRVLVVSETGPDTVVSEFGIADSLTIALSDAPSTPVEVTLTADVAGEIDISPSTLVFTSADWDLPQTVAISGIEDYVADGDSLVNVSVSVVDANSDPAYQDVESVVVPVTNREHEHARVVARHVFYNNSRYDGFSADIEVADDNAVAPSPENAVDSNLGKIALLPGEKATFQNYTSYSRGINGIMIDVLGLADPNSISENDFEFRVGTSNDVTDWSLAPAPEDIKVREGGGTQGADRITIVWDDNVIEKTWLQVRVLPTASTGLNMADVHYWGNAIGETGNRVGRTLVNQLDKNGVLLNLHSIVDLADIEDAYDFNRDRVVTTLDRNIILNNITTIIDFLPLITPPLSVSIDAVEKDTESLGDFITDDQTLYIHGGFTEGSSLEVSINGETYSLGADSELTSDGLGNWTLNYTAVELAEGNYPVSVVSTLGTQTANAAQTISVVPPVPPPPAIPDLDSNLVAFWDFDGDFMDDALLGLMDDDLTEQGEASLILGGLGTHALHMGGNAAHQLTAASSPDLNETSLDEFSVSLWFHTRDQVDGTRVLYQQGDETKGLILYLIDGQLYAGAWDMSVGWTGTWLTAPTQNYAWQHVTLTIDATADTMSLYSDGFLVDEGFAGVVPAHAPASIASSTSATRIWNPTQGAVETVTPESWLGWVDDVRVYRRVLNSVDALELATSVLPNKVVADLPIDENVPAPSYQLPTGGTTHVVPASTTTAALQAILDGLQGNDIVRLDPAGTWESIVLRNTSPGVKYIISDAIDSLPAFGQRVNASHANLMPTITTGTFDTGPVLPALNSEIGASDYHIAGVRLLKPIITGQSSGLPGHHGNVSLAMLNRVPVGGANNTLPALSPPILGEVATTYEALGGGFVFDRVIFEGDDLRTSNGLLLSAKDTAVVGSYFHKIIEKRIDDQNGSLVLYPGESHGVEIVDSPGRILLENNYFSVGSIAVMAGNNGGLTTDTSPYGGQIPGLVPPMEDIVVRNNFITKDLAWASEILLVAGSAALKNALETKGANRLLWEDNYIENILAGNQKHALVVKVGNGQETDNVTIRNNHVMQATGGISLSNQLDADNGNSPLRVGNISIYDNEIVDIGPMLPIDDSFPIVQVTSFGDPIEALVMFDNELRRRVYNEPEEVGFAFTNNQSQHIADFSFLSNEMDCAQWGGFAGTGLGTKFDAVLANFTDRTSMEENVFIACSPYANIPQDNTIFAASATIGTPTGDGFLNLAESSQTITITGTLTGDANAGDAVSLRVNGVLSTGVSFLDGSTLRYSIDVAGSDLAADSDAVIDLSFTTTNPAGISITPTATRAYTVDLLPPTVEIDVIAVDDTVNGIEDDAVLAISGTTDAEDGQSVTVTLNSNSYSATVSSGTWTVDIPVADVQALPASSTVTADVMDQAGNAATQATRTLLYDPTSPSAPTVTITEDADDNGFMSGLEVSGDVDVSVMLPVEAVEGDTLTITDGVTPQQVVLTSGDIGATVVTTTFAALAEGTTLTVTSWVTDIAGNEGPSDSDAATLDTTAPTLAIDMIASDDTVNGIEDDAVLAISGTTDAEDGQSVTVTLNSKSYSATVSSGTWTVDIPVADVQALPASSTVTADVMDLAGNAATQATRKLLYDPTAPSAPTVTITEDADDNGFISGLEASGDVDVSVTLPVEAVEGDTLTITDGVTPQQVVLTSGDIGATVVTTTLAALAEGTTLTVTSWVTDIAGNEGPSDSDAATLDTTAPTLAIDMMASDDTVNGIEDDAVLTISGTSDADGQSVTVTLNSNSYLATVSSGTWTVDIPVADVQALPASSTVTADVMDLAGNAATQATRTLLYDPTAPSAPTVTITEDADDNGFISGLEASGDVDVSVTLPVEAVEGDTLTITDGVTPQQVVLTSGDIGATVVTTTFAALAEGTTLTVTSWVTDIASNEGLSDSDAATLDTTAPTLAIDMMASDDTVNGIEDDAVLTISGTSDADGQSVTVTLNSNSYSATVSSGTWTVDIPVADVQALPAKLSRDGRCNGSGRKRRDPGHTHAAVRSHLTVSSDRDDHGRH